MSTKRSLEASQRRRRHARKRTRRLLDFARRSPALDEDAEIAVNLGGVKMSEVLKEFAHPLLETARTPEEYRSYYMLGAIAWNLAEAGPESRREAFSDFESVWAGTRGATPAEQELLETALNALIERKKQLFPHVRRFVLDVEFGDRPDEYDIVVLSTPVDQPEED